MTSDSTTTDTVSSEERVSNTSTHSLDSNHSERILQSEEIDVRVGGYIEEKPLEIQGESLETTSPPSYDLVMAEKTHVQDERELLGNLLMKMSILIGMHLFKAPYMCDGNVCHRRSFRARVCPVAITLCIINILVIFNHFRFHVLLFYKKSQENITISSIFSSEKAEMLMKAVDSALPMVCVSGMIFTSYHMHNLLRKLTDTHFSVIQKKCKVRFWRIVLYFINFFFVVGAIMELPQNFMKEIRSTNSSNILDKPLKDMESIPDQIMIAVDRYYFPIINFGVVKIPQLFIMMISIRIALMFRISTSTLTHRYHLSKEILREYFTQLIDVIDVLQSLEGCFNKLILAIVTTSVMKIIFTSYVTIRQLTTSTETGIFSTFISDNMNPGKDAGVFANFVYTTNSTCTVFSMLLNALWTVIFIVPCIWCNEESRQALPVLTSNLVSDDAKNLKDQIIQKLNDHTWGLTLGKFVKVDRAFAVSFLMVLNLDSVPITIEISSDEEGKSATPTCSIESSHSEGSGQSQETDFIANGHIQSNPLEDLVATKAAPSSPMASGEPPSYDLVMAEQIQIQEERELIGALLMKLSLLIGMHPFKAPYQCNGNVCHRRTFRARMDPVAMTLCMVNILVIFNHFRLFTLVCNKGYKSKATTVSIFSSERAEVLMKTVDSILPMVCVLGMIFTSYHMHNLLRKLTETNFSMMQKKCKVRFWRILLYIINFFFVTGAIMELPQNFMKEIRSTNSSDLVDKPLKEMDSVFDQIMIAVDRYYFPIINFGVVRIPQLFIMMISIRIALMFRISTSTLTHRYHLSKEILREYFTQLLDVIEVLQSLESCFNKLILAIVATSVVKIVFTSFVTIRQLVTSPEPGMFSMFIGSGMDPGKDAGILVTILYAMNSTCTVFSLVLNAVWAVVFIVPCIWCNEESRQALPVLTSNLVPDDAKNLKDQIIQKLNDHTWGLTLGKFVKVDRAFAVSIMSLVFTVVVVWLQLSAGNNRS
ncbi:hypothetical protein FO519_002740 [Halicephalobus sp. NKZ332]|nr:hypothetical protein FO519_002740 [Halicephalobus sp. NKZ332]